MPYHFSHHRKQEASHILGNQAIEAFSTRFSQFLVVLAREPATFWQENVIVVVTLL